MVIGEFNDVFPPFLDGTGRVTQSYCSHLNQMGHQAYYVAPFSPRWEDLALDFPVILQRSIRIPSEPYRLALPKLDAGYRRALDAVPFDIVHTHSPFAAGHEALRIARRRGIPLVATFHSKYRDDMMGKFHSRTVSDFVVKMIVHFYELCDAVWTVNAATADVLREYGYRGEIGIMENGTDPEPLDALAVEELNARLGRPNGLQLLFVGQHNYKKNLHGVLGACALLKEQRIPFQLVTAGSGADFHHIVAEAGQLGIADDCHFLGFVDDRATLMALYARADLLVFPSLYDNAPMVLREAAVMGTPGLVVRGSCAAEGVTDGMNGFVCEDEHPEAIARTIRRAMPNLREVGNSARETIPVPWSRILEGVVCAYEALIRDHHSP